MDKHPDAIAWEKFKADNATCFDPQGVTAQYLSNRLWRAFMAGIEHGESLPPPPADTGEKK